MLQVEDAQQRILAAVPALGSETIPLTDAIGRVLAQPVIAPIDLPLFDNSAMDGYAVRSPDVASASDAAPVRLRLIGRSAAGEVFDGEVGAGQCVRVFTGSVLPNGADAVVMQEDTTPVDGDATSILVRDTARPWENVRFRGEDIKRGTFAVAAGARLGVGHVSLLAALGVTDVSVGRRPRVALLATGSELREAGQPLSAGQIYESNRLGLAALVRQRGGEPLVMPLVPDQPDATREALENALAKADVVVSSGGVSVGELDLVKPAFEQLGGRIELWRVAIKPGKPFVFGQCGGKFLFGLPGNPVSALVSFLVFVAPALARMQGASDLFSAASVGVLAEPLGNRGDRRHFVRVRVDAEGKVRLAGTQASHILSSLAEANGLVDVPPNTNWETGRSTRVLRWD